MAQTREASLWLAMLFGGCLPRRQAKEIIRRWLDGGHTRLGEIMDDDEQASLALGLSDEERRGLEACRDALDAGDAQLRRLAEHGVDMFTRPDIAYPQALAERLGEDRAPYTFFCAGDLGLLTESFVAVIGANDPPDDAIAMAPKIASAVNGAGFALVGGYAVGLDRMTMDAAQEAGQRNLLVVPLGIEPMLPTLDRWQLPDEDGTRLALSPFAPDAMPSKALSSAREALVVALADAVVLVAPDHGPLDATWWREAKDWGLSVAVWSGSDANIARAWIEQGAVAFDNEVDLRAALAGESSTESRWPSDADLAVEPLEPFSSAEEAIATLSSMGNLPDSLAKKLRESEFYQHDPDPYLADEQESPE